MTYIRKNVLQPANNAGIREEFDTHLVWIPLDIIEKEPKRDTNGARMIGNFKFKPDAYVQKIYATSSSIKIGKPSDGDQDAVGFNQNAEAYHPGTEIEIEEFSTNTVNVPGMLAVGIGLKGANPYYKILGSCDAPIYCKPETESGNDGAKTMLKFESITKTKKGFGFYFGTFPFETPLAVVPADTAVVDVELGNGEYQLSDNTVATTITDFNNVEEGTVVTLVGSVGATPSTLDSAANIWLQDGASWTALPGSKITLKAVSNGVNSFGFIELGRE